eukprot:scaffold24507_cov106-Isochrysis_galbana.AAC.2
MCIANLNQSFYIETFADQARECLPKGLPGGCGSLRRLSTSAPQSREKGRIQTPSAPRSNGRTVDAPRLRCLAFPSAPRPMPAAAMLSPHRALSTGRRRPSHLGLTCRPQPRRPRRRCRCSKPRRLWRCLTSSSPSCPSPPPRSPSSSSQGEPPLPPPPSHRPPPPPPPPAAAAAPRLHLSTDPGHPWAMGVEKSKAC